MYKPFWALLFILSCTYSAAFADDPTSEKLSDLFDADGNCKGWGGVAPAPSENECRSFIEAALKEQRSQVEAGEGDAAEGASAIAQEDQINAVNQVNEETTADASTENIESTNPSEAVEVTNENVEISEKEPDEHETQLNLEQAPTEEAVETQADSIEADSLPAESSEAELEIQPTETTFSEPEEVVTESPEVEAVRAESAEETTTESAEAEVVSTLPEEVATEVKDTPIEAESVLDSADTPAEAVEAEVVPTESAEAETAPLESAEAEVAPTQSAEAELAPTESAEAELASTESAEAEIPESIEVTQSEITDKEVEEQLEKELAGSVLGETEQTTEEAISVEEVIRNEGELAAEDIVQESQETETLPEVPPVSSEEQIQGDQPAVDASGEAPVEHGGSASQEVGSEQIEDQASAEQTEMLTEQNVVQEASAEEIVEEVIQELVEETVPVVEDVDSIRSQAVEVEPSEEQIKAEVSVEEQVVQTEIVEPLAEETVKEQELPTKTQESAVAAEELISTKAEETPAVDLVVEETPVESAESLQQEIAPEPQTEEVSEPQAEAVTVDEGVEEDIPEQEDLTLKIEIPDNLRSRSHITEVLRLDSGFVETGAKLLKTEETTLKELKRVYEAAIKPLEILYKYRDLSNRHFGDPEIFSKPLVLFMGPWSGGKSTIINYLLDNEYKQTSLRTGAEPSPAYFNIVMWGEREEIMDGTQLAADWTFSGLQKFGQGLLDRLRGLKLNSPLLEKVNIVEIPGILEIRKQVERLFPLNDACQWFIDRADIIFLVYDPSKLDVGPETEAILDQLKGREYQTKIILNKADQVKPEELMRVQGTLIWNISPLMSSTEPPVMYSTSLWSHPYQPGSPSRLLFAQEKAFLKDLREAMEKRVENKISSARRFAVRVRNHAKMVDCYLTTYYNHKTFFGNKQKVSDDIIEHPQNYHIYEGLSTLTNISRYDLPDPDVYRDFFRLNPVYDFQQLASTCTYFKGCPINRLDVAIAYDLPELVGRYKKVAEDVKSQGKK